MDTETHFIDRVGEDTDPSDCAICHAVSCFPCVHGYCTALEKYAEGGCAFYKDTEENRREIRRCFYRLISHERFDLLIKYADTMAALGLMDNELSRAADQCRQLESYRKEHLAVLQKEHWMDTLVIVHSVDVENDDESCDSDSPEVQKPEADPNEEFDNDIDPVEFPDDITTESINDEVSEDIMDAMSFSEEQETTLENDDELPIDYPEDIIDNGSMTYAEWIEHEEERELVKEAEEEKAANNMEYECEQAESGNAEYIAMPVNYFYRKIGFPVRRKQPPDPVALATSVLGANIVYKAAEDYITTLRMLWSGEHNEQTMRRLIINKWEQETFIGSNAYSLYTNINPNRILDQCWKTAEEQAQKKIERINRRVVAGIEGGDGA